MSSDRYSHGHHESVLRSHRWRTAENSAAFLLPHLVPGMALLDVGCGPGNITADLANVLGGGSVIGIDLSEDVISIAAKENPSSNDVDLSFEVGDVYHLGYDEGVFDVVYAHQVLQHLTDPIEALAQMRRVLKPGGLLAIRDADFGAFLWSPSIPMLDRWIDLYRQITQRNGAESHAGRYLKAWARAAGFDDAVLSSSNWTYQTSEERAWWGGLWADRVLESEFARQGVEYGLTTIEELADIARAFRQWAADPDGVFVVVNCEVLAHR